MKHHVLTIAIVALIAAVGIWAKQRDEQRARENRAIAQQARHLADQSKHLAAQSKRLAAQGKQAHDALCVFRGGLKSDIDKNARQLTESGRFIRNHPQGAFGYTHTQLLALNAKAAADIRTQRRRLHALNALHHC